MDPRGFDNNAYFRHHFDNSNTGLDFPPNTYPTSNGLITMDVDNAPISWPDEPTVPFGQRHGTEAPSMPFTNIPAADYAVMANAADACKQAHQRSRTRAELERPRTESPIPIPLQLAQPTNPIMRERGSASSGSTARSSYETPNTGRSSAISMDPEDTALASQSVMSEPAQERTVPVQLAYMCPKCNMGHGRETHVYTTAQRKKRKIDETRDTRMETPALNHDHDTIYTPRPHLEFEIFESQWKSSAPLRKHIMAIHIYDFQRSNSSEFVCCYCTCGYVSERSSTCSARFQTAEEMANHICTRHAGGPRRLSKFQHHCAPISDTSYPEYVRDQIPHGH
ncbi:hypothetical protein HBI95_173090 [Parastagonospora nodorum]|nr:hypothetical protein HBH43_050730 [Parastagonospora nodorum]KAH4200703.1 hypothetical protein HBI95_173090 [Parastagonospora nodorum]KAH4606364.1 hypothetical protein HBH82_103900 [Parastagonospora nodorum]KAH4713375.1 hypothetical protein HBH67_007220 [Parastagonospora nodorum]KAH4728429.1 hypothetical protein HBH78_015830 [Parastagonospora nodorum]